MLTSDSTVAIVSAPLWDSHISRFAGILTATDYINVIQYHCQFPDEMSKLDQFRLASLPGNPSPLLTPSCCVTVIAQAIPG